MRNKRRVILPAVVITGVLLLAAREPILLGTGDYLAVQDALRPADVIHVIAGADDRTDYAIQLYKQGYGKRILFTGGWCKTHGYYHGQHGAERAAAQGVPVESIIVDETPVSSTYDEVVRLQRLVAASNGQVRSVITVSDAFHGRRGGLDRPFRAWRRRLCPVRRPCRIEDSILSAPVVDG